MLAVLCGGLTVFVGGDHRRPYSFRIKGFGKSRAKPQARPERLRSGRAGGGSGSSKLASPSADRGVQAAARYFAAAASPIRSALCFAPSTAIVVTSTASALTASSKPVTAGSLRTVPRRMTHARTIDLLSIYGLKKIIACSMRAQAQTLLNDRALGSPKLSSNRAGSFLPGEQFHCADFSFSPFAFGHSFFPVKADVFLTQWCHRQVWCGVWFLLRAAS
jgi:hypothetical protein